MLCTKYIIEINAIGEYTEINPNSYIRLFHASSNAPAIDVHKNGNIIVQNLSYKDFTQYIPIAPGKYNIKIYTAGEIINPVLDEELYILQGTAFNVAVVSELFNISLYSIPEPYTAQNFGKSCIRFVNLSPDTSAVDLTLSDGREVFRNVGYKDITNYVCVPSGTYNFGVRPVGSGEAVLTIENLQVESNNYYTVYTTGLVQDISSLDVVSVLEPRWS